METKTKASYVTKLTKPCIRVATLVSVFFDGDVPMGTVEVSGIQFDSSFHFNCQHWIYNRNIPDMTPADTGFSSLCIGDQVTVLSVGALHTIVGRHNPEETGVIRQLCWPIFDSSRSFAVAPLSNTNYLLTWGAPFVAPSSTPFDFVNPQVDVFGETRPLGTVTTASTALGSHIRLITEHEINDEFYYVAHTLHEAIQEAPYGVFLSPATTENSRFFLGRKLTYNSVNSHFIIDDIVRVSGVIDASSLHAIMLYQEGAKIYITTFSKVLDRIADAGYSGTMPQIEMSVGYYEKGRIDHLFCLTKLLASGGVQAIQTLPEYGSLQYGSVIVDRYVMSVKHVGPAVIAGNTSVKLLFYAFGVDAYGNAAHNYEMSIVYDSADPALASIEVTEQDPYLWEPSMTGGSITGSVTGQPAKYPYPIDFCDVTCSASHLSGPDYPAVIGGNHVMTGGIYGDVSDFRFEQAGTVTSFWHEYYKTNYTYVSTERRKVSVEANTSLVYKHDGLEITRGTSVLSSNCDQDINYDYWQSATPGDTWGRYLTGDNTSYSVSLSWSEVHWLVTRPDLELYVFVEVQVFTDHEPFKEWPSEAVVAKYYVWYRGEKTFLSEKSINFPSVPTLYQYTYYLDMLGTGMNFDSRALNSFWTDCGIPRILCGKQVRIDGSVTTVGFPIAGWDDSWDFSPTLRHAIVPRFYWYPNHTYDSYLNDDGVIVSLSAPYDLHRTANGAAFPNFAFSPVIEGDGSGWVVPLSLYNTDQVSKGYVEHWTWLADSNELSSQNFGISDDDYSTARPFTPAMLYFKSGVSLGKPQFFGDYLYITIPDVFTTGLVHEFFSGPDDVLSKIKASVNVGAPDDVIFTTNVA